tara:strand:- start:173 stop:634 length:462 start_codon:yes stop_codon:yes gene_type:complete
MNSALVKSDIVPSMTVKQIEAVAGLELRLLPMPQVEIETKHVFHAGVYSRTVCGKKGTVFTAALLKVPTMLIISGDVSIYIGSGVVRKTGYHLLRGDVGRKQAFFCHEDTHMTMLFATDAQTVEDAEAECTNEASKLMSRRNKNDVIINGENL